VHFGHRTPAPLPDDPEREVGEYALHIQCAWRLSGPGGVIAGWSDMYVAADPDLPEEEFRWDRPGASIADAQLRPWLEAHAEPPPVLDLAVDRCAGFVLRLPGEQALEVFPDAYALPHDLREQWRVFRPGEESPHFVVSNHGWDEHPAA